MRVKMRVMDLIFKSCHNSTLDLLKYCRISKFCGVARSSVYAIKFSVVGESVISLAGFFFFLSAAVIVSLGKYDNTGFVRTGNSANMVR